MTMAKPTTSERTNTEGNGCQMFEGEVKKKKRHQEIAALFEGAGGGNNANRDRN